MIYLLRHGEIESGGKRFIGQLDISLSRKGREQAKLWKERLSQIEFDEIFSSDLSRCLETAHIIAGGRNIHVLRKLREISLGEWDGLIRDDVRKRFPDEWEIRGRDFGYSPPGGESFNDLHYRVVPVFEEIAELNSENILIVAHAGVIRIIISHVLDMPVERIFMLGQDYAAMNFIDNKKKPMQLVAMNCLI